MDSSDDALTGGLNSSDSRMTIEDSENGPIIVLTLKFSRSSRVFSDSGNESTGALTLNSSLVLSATGQSRRQDMQNLHLDTNFIHQSSRYFA